MLPGAAFSANASFVFQRGVTTIGVGEWNGSLTSLPSLSNHPRNGHPLFERTSIVGQPAPPATLHSRVNAPMSFAKRITTLDEQLSKAQHPIWLTLPGIVILLNPLAPLNALAVMRLHPTGTIKSTNLAPLTHKQAFPQQRRALCAARPYTGKCRDAARGRRLSRQ